MRSYPAVWITVMRCSMASVIVCSGVCSRSRMRRRAFSRELADATTSHQFSGEAAGRLEAGHSRLQVVARSSSMVPGRRLPADGRLRTPQVRPANANLLFPEQTLDLATGVSRLRVREFGTVYPPHRGSLTLNLDTERLLKAFLFGETSVH